MDKNDNVILITTKNKKQKVLQEQDLTQNVGVEWRNEDWEVFLKDSLKKRLLSFALEDEQELG